jgi:hypothetical protein
MKSRIDSRHVVAGVFLQLHVSEVTAKFEKGGEVTVGIK